MYRVSQKGLTVTFEGVERFEINKKPYYFAIFVRILEIYRRRDYRRTNEKGPSEKW